MSEQLLTSQQWQEKVQAKYPNFVVMDADGWDRSHFDESWNEQISWEEFQKRAGYSTCMYPDQMFIDIVMGVFDANVLG